MNQITSTLLGAEAIHLRDHRIAQPSVSLPSLSWASDDACQFASILQVATSLSETAAGLIVEFNRKGQIDKATRGCSALVAQAESLVRLTNEQNDVYVIDDSHFGSSTEGALRFFTGVPLRNTCGEALGVLCVFDTAPKLLPQAKLEGLILLARQAALCITNDRDLLETTRKADDLAASHLLLSTCLDNLPILTWLKDSKGKFVLYGKGVESRFGLKPGQWLGKTSSDIWSPQIANEIECEEQYLLSSKGQTTTYITLPEPNGDSSYWKTVKKAVTNDQGETMLLCSSLELTEELKREAEQQRLQEDLERKNHYLRTVAERDQVTGLSNELGLARVLDSICAATTSRPVSLLAVETSDLRMANQRFGRETCDEVLQSIGGVLGNRFPRCAARVSGSLFYVVLPDCDTNVAAFLASEVSRSLAELELERFDLSTYVATTTSSKPRLNRYTLFRQVDGALRAARNQQKTEIFIGDGAQQPRLAGLHI